MHVFLLARAIKVSRSPRAARSDGGDALRNVSTDRLTQLTAREIEILRLLATGKSLSEIAWSIKVSCKTIANTSSIIRRKLGLRIAAEMVRFAIEEKLG